MTDFRSLYDRDYLGSWNITGDTIVTIKDVKKGKLKSAQSDKESSKAIIHFAEFDKPMVCNITNARAIASLYGAHVEKWKGKKLTLFVAQVQAFGATHDCLRIRPDAPADVGSTKKRVESKEFVFNGPDGEQKFDRAGAWLDALEGALKPADPETAGTLWDGNLDTFNEIQAALLKADNKTGLARANEIGRLANERMNK